MSVHRTAQRIPVIERRPAVSAVVHRSAAAAVGHGLQARLGNQATHALVTRAVSPSIQTAAAEHQSKATRLAVKVSKPTDPAEREAEETARKVVRMSQPPAVKPTTTTTSAKQTAQRSHDGAAPARAALPPAMSGLGAGAPLPAPVRRHMEPRFGAGFGHVRIHTNDAAAKQSTALNAHAFTLGNHIVFGRDKFQPQTARGQELIAHELTHTIQQGSSAQRDVAQRSFLGIKSPREYFAGKAEGIPGFTMLTVVIGYNPITNSRVERNAGNILRGAIQLIPGGSVITDALNNHGIFDRVSAWAHAQFETIKDIGSAIRQSIEEFISSGIEITDLGGTWERAKAIVLNPIARLKAFAIALKDGIVTLIKNAILNPIAAYARTTSGYPLLCTVMGKDPITGEPVAQDAETLLGAFMKFIGEEELWNTMQKAKAVPRAFAWFKGAVAALKGFISEIPGLFVQAFRALEVIDILVIPRAFVKLAGVFGGFAKRFVTWGANAVWTLLEIIVDVVSPGALTYIKKTGAALKSILRNPLPFVGNLVRAAKLGFLNFADRFLDHLKAGLIDWLTGSLPGIYIPKAFSLVEIAKFAFSVLGLTWANIRAKLVKATSETAVKAMETGFDIVVTLVRDGPAAAWDKIKEQLANLKDMVIGGITSFVVDMVVKKAIPKLIAMFIPGAGFISAILSIYDTVMVFVNKLAKIVQVVKGFIDSIVAIASGAIDAAATRVENTLAGLLSLAINFLAGFVGLGKVADKVMAVIEKIRKPIDKALDWLIGWIVKMAKSLFAKGKAAVKKVLGWAFATTKFKDAEGKQHTVSIDDRGKVLIQSTPTAGREFVDWYVKEQGGDAKLGGEIKKLIGKTEDLVAAIEKARPPADKDKPPAPAKQKELLELNTEISAKLSQLVGRDALGDNLEKKYLLEGQVGTYATIPKPVGDQLTPDHQPQASIILAASDFFKEQGIEGGALATRAEGRAAQGYAINLHFKRHTAGATYGSKGETRQSFLGRLRKGTQGKKTDAAKKDVVVKYLKDALKEDVKEMKKVAGMKLDTPPWAQLKEEFKKPPKKAQQVKDQIAERIIKGQDQVASQPFNF